MKRSEYNAMLASIAQGVVNIAEGMTTIEQGSRIHRAMEQLCTAAHKGQIVLADPAPSHVVAVGDAFNGISLIGPFYDTEVANDYAENNHPGDDWHIVVLDPPPAEELSGEVF